MPVVSWKQRPPAQVRRERVVRRVGLGCALLLVWSTSRQVLACMEAFTGIGCISKNSRTACRLQQGSRRVCQGLLAEAPLASAQAPAAEVSWRQPSWEERFNGMILPAARIISDTGGLGSGIIIASNANGTYVLTNHHIVTDNIQQIDKWDSLEKSSKKVERLLPVKVETFRYDQRGCHIQTVTTLSEIVAYTPYGDRWDFEGDLAVLRMRTDFDGDAVAKVISAEDFDDEVRTLDEIVMVGCPDGSDLPLPTTGHVASLSQERAGVALMLSQVFGNPGSSGSAVFRYSADRNAFEVIAVHSMIDRRGRFDSEGGRGGFLRLAVPATVLHSFLKTHGLDHLVTPPDPIGPDSENATVANEAKLDDQESNNSTESSSGNESTANATDSTNASSSDAADSSKPDVPSDASGDAPDE